MAEQNQNLQPDMQTDQGKSASPIRVISVTGILIFAVLALANFDALLKPLQTLLSILTPITIGLVVAYLCNPFLKFYEYKVFIKIKRRRVNLACSLFAAYLTLLGIIAGIMLLVVPQVVGSVDDLRNNGMTYITTLIDFINQTFSSIPLIGNNAGELVSFEKLLTYLMQWLAESGGKILGDIGNLASGILTVLKNILVGIFVSIYVLIAKDRLNAVCRRILRALLSRKHEEMVLHYLTTAHTKFGGFLIGKIFDSTIIGILCGILFSIFHIPYAVLIAVIIGVTDIIPFFGPFIGAIPSGLIIFIVSPSKALLFVVLILIVQQIDGNLIAPWILGDRTGLSSLGVLVAVTVTGNLLGIAGMVIGVPLFALLMTIFEDFIAFKCKEKGAETDVRAYYPADAFIRPEEEAAEPETMTKRFVKWVRTIENPPEEVKGTKFSKGFRRMCLAIGRFFVHVFAVRPIPEDAAGSIQKRIMREGMCENRNFFACLGLSIVSLLIYPLYLIEVFAQCTNMACSEDGRRTWGVFPYLLTTIFTLLSFPYIWHCQVINRFTKYCESRGEKCVITKKYYLLWGLLGLLVVVGPFIAAARFLRATNQVARLYNQEHPVKK